MSADLTIGKTYQVNSSRKGKFTGIVTQCCDTWATVLITSGKPVHSSQSMEAVACWMDVQAFVKGSQ